MKKKSKALHKSVDSNFKRCPECFTKLPLDAVKCFSCGQIVGKIDQYGIAKKPLNWVGYLTAIGLWVGLAYYIWWAFF